MTLLTGQLLASFDDSVGLVSEARLLPPVLYTSPEFYEFERRAIFQREWLCVGRADQLKEPGDFRCITIAGEPLIAARDHPLFAYLFEAAEAGVDNFNVQDIYVDEMTQKGLSSHLAPRGRYSWQEETLVQFNRWLVRRYRGRWPSNGS